MSLKTRSVLFDIFLTNALKQPVSLIPAEFFGGNPGEFAEVIFGTQQSATATATLNQLLFDGSYIVGLQSAKVFLEISLATLPFKASFKAKFISDEKVVLLSTPNKLEKDILTKFSKLF